MNKQDVIAKIYYDPAGHGSVRKTYLDAHKKDGSISEADVKAWFYKNLQRKTDLAGHNSFITHEPKEEYQMDFMFFFELQDPEYYGGVLMADSFSKYCVVVPQNNKAATLLEAMKEGIQKMGGVRLKPLTAMMRGV